MEKELLTRSVVNVLKEAGFLVSSMCDIRPRSFDLAARRESLLLLLKILSNIDGLNERTASEITRLAAHLLGQPLIVGEKTRDQLLERGAVYFRYGVPTVSLQTLADYLLAGIPPLVYAAHGGLYVKIDGELLRRLRISRGISIGELAAELGVSRRTVSKYESETMDTSVDIALKLEEIFDEELIQAVDIFKQRFIEDSPTEVKDKLLRRLVEIGLRVFPISQAPFNAITRDDDMVVLTGVSRMTSNMIKRARLMSNLSSVTLTHSAVIVDGETKIDRIERTAVICRKEIEKIDSREEFADLLMLKKDRAAY